MIECRGAPGSRGMACLAGPAEIACRMIRVHCLIESTLMALSTAGVHKLIVAIDMAGLALQSRVFPCQRELRRVMIECRRRPGCCGVARLAVLAEIARYVTWVRRLLKICQMTLNTTGVHQMIVASGMASLAGLSCVGAGEGKSCPRMVERCRLPRRGRMARLALRREPRTNVIGICGGGICLLVAGYARDRQSLERIIRMTARAGLCLVSPCQRETRQLMVKAGAPG